MSGGRTLPVNAPTKDPDAAPADSNDSADPPPVDDELFGGADNPSATNDDSLSGETASGRKWTDAEIAAFHCKQRIQKLEDELVSLELPEREEQEKLKEISAQATQLKVHEAVKEIEKKKRRGGGKASPKKSL